MTPSDIATVESRIAELSGERAGWPPPAAGSVAAFAALVGAVPAVAVPRVGANAPLPNAALERLIAGACASNGADPALVKAIVANESGFDSGATSAAGAQGLMQLMPGTAAGLGVSDAYDPAQNIGGGTRYLVQLLQRFNGDIPTAVAAYNAGPQTIAHGEMPAETQQYVRSVLASYAQYREKP